MDPKVLAETVKKFNQHAAGKDEEFGRIKSTMQPVKDDPFSQACPLVAGGPNTKGGLACNAKREVLDGT